MANYIPTLHSKVRYSQRVDYRESMDATVKNAKKFGVKLDDIPIEYDRLRGFIQRNKIYYNERIYIFAEQVQYKTLVTVYYSKSKLLEEIFQQKEKQRKKKYYRQMLTTQTNVLYSVTLYKGRVCEVKIIPKREYTYKLLEDKDLMISISKHFAKLLKGKESLYDIKLYLEDFDELEKKVYRRVIDIPRGEKVTYKILAEELKITVQKLSKILNKCTIPVFVPTHRVVKSNGQIGSHCISAEFKKKILDLEIESINKLNIQNVKKEEVEDNITEYLCYSISDLLQNYIK